MEQYYERGVFMKLKNLKHTAFFKIAVPALMPSFFALMLFFGIFAYVSGNERNRTEQDLGLAGFAYDEAQDIFYSTMNAWQRNMGYTAAYDEGAPSMSMVIDCEPVYFDHGGKHWLIELWKGQYGITAGGEIGVYYNADSADMPPENRFYSVVDDNGRLNMKFTLEHKSQPVFERDELHWWLTGFDLGRYAPPDQLIMRAQIELPDKDMRDDFTAALKKLGYSGEGLKTEGDTVHIIFDTPKSAKPKSRTPEQDKAVLERNKAMIDTYHELVDEGTNAIDGLQTLRRERPDLYREALGIRGDTK